MHELSVAMSIVDIATERCRAEQASVIRRVAIEVGALAMIVPDALQLAFEVASRGTEAEGSSLDIAVQPARARCQSCEAELELDDPFGRCGCGSTFLSWLSGEQMLIVEMEVA